MVSLHNYCMANDRMDLLEQWHPLKNDLMPDVIAPMSNKKVWWRCNKGHEWQAQVYSRVKSKGNPGCPYCANKAILVGYNDLATTHPELLPEWHPTKNGDLKPTMVTAGSRRKVWWRCEKGHEWEAMLVHRTRDGSGCRRCNDVRPVVVGKNDLATTHPELAATWHPTKNGELKPTMVSKGSDKKVWWQCEKGHEWEALINSRVSGAGCPYCANHFAWAGDNDLATTRPEIAATWHPTKNGDLKPTMVTAGSGKKVWWQCAKGHEWEMMIRNRSRGGPDYCPVCSGRTGRKKKEG